MDTGISEQDARLLAKELDKAWRAIRGLQAKVNRLSGIVEDQDALVASRARLSETISKIEDLAAGGSERDFAARIRAIREIANEGLQ